MHRLVAILLIPIFVVGNSLAHSHGQPAHSSQEHGRAHFHVGNTSHHDASHESHDHSHGHSHHGHHQHSHDKDPDCGDSNSVPVEAPVDHDSDAIYLIPAELALNPSDRASLQLDAEPLILTTDWSFVDMQEKIQPPQLDQSPPSKLPIYLLNAALRI